MNRRNFIKNLIVGTTSLASGLIIPNVYAKTELLPYQVDALNYEKQNKGKRTIWLKRELTGEEILLNYKIEGQIQKEYKAVCHILRDVKADKSCNMDENLLDLIYSMQQFIWEHGHTVPFVIKSGYRTKKTNDNTEGSARNSLHLYGMATDIHLENLSNKYISGLAELYKSGGVGFYPNKSFVHIDVGQTRKWILG